MIKHVLFDLDGTLLPMKQDEFIKYYLGLLTEKFAGEIDTKVFTNALWAGMSAMITNDGTRTNEDAFWGHFEKLLPNAKEEIEDKLTNFYNNEFNQVIASTQPSPYPTEIISKLKSAGTKVYLATNPLFPACATLNRIRWAGMNAGDFEEITTYENYHYCKPNVLYFKEIMNKFHLDPSECLMVGNDVEEDLSIRELGVKTFLVTDCLENKKRLDIKSEYAGSLEHLKNVVLDLL